MIIYVQRGQTEIIWTCIFTRQMALENINIYVDTDGHDQHWSYLTPILFQLRWIEVEYLLSTKKTKWTFTFTHYPTKLE